MFLQCNDIRLFIIDLENIEPRYDSILTEAPKEISFYINCEDNDRCEYFRKRRSNVQFWQSNHTDEKFVPMMDFPIVLHDTIFEPYETVFLTGNLNDVQYATKECISTILLNTVNGEVDRNKLPDFEVQTPEQLKEIFTNKRKGFFHEMVINNESGIGNFKLLTLRHQLFLNYTAKLVVGGRFFVDGDHRCYSHPLTQMIRLFKYGNKNTFGKLARVIKSSLDIIQSNIKEIDIITHVPAKPSKVDYLEALLKEQTFKDYSTKIRSDILKAKRDYAPQKNAGSWMSRAYNVHDEFDVISRVTGHVVLIDDIVTSGSTTMECARMLYNHGAEEVTIVCMGAMQSNSDAGFKNPIICSNCGGFLKLKFNKHDGSVFWGCENFYSRGCKSTLNYDDGRKKYNLQNVKQYHEEDNLPF
ncbi:DNA utilization protein GntX [Parageobacillus caldoxylosilyticus]|uniref:ComF family protein n=1 Tax=Saccharococcus caldoxylosilyticus TaxID=81408 RepID=UPI001C4E2DF2|nr:hypothetical protein [Parageobacillus caldoxylosilyticus]QXJ39565.1 DNA utilization protein GntX [Parageobacillus caldoxylosilyticus]